MNPEPEYAAFIGVDWACRKHAVVLRQGAGGRLETLEISSNPRAIHDWALRLQNRFAGQRVALCVELSRGALIEQLGRFDFIDIYPLNPVTSARFRKAFKPSGTKDDFADARRHLTILTQHRDELTLWKPSAPEDQRPQLLCEGRRKLVHLQVDLRYRLFAVLRDYFPQALDLAGKDPASLMACNFLLKWADLGSLKRAKENTVRAFYYANRCRRGDLIEKRLRLIREAVPVTENESFVAPCALHAKCLAEQLKTIARSIAQMDKEIEDAFAEHPDAVIWKSFPGAGELMAPRLAAAWTTDRERFVTANDMQCYSGTAPVRNASGTRETVFRRYNRPLFIHQTFWEYARLSTQFCPWAQAYLDQQAKRGIKRTTIYRSLAFKWQRIMHRCRKDGIEYDDKAYIESLARSGSPYHLEDAA